MELPLPPSQEAPSLQIHDEVILEGPEASADEAFGLVLGDMQDPFDRPLLVDLVVDAKVRRQAGIGVTLHHPRPAFLLCTMVMQIATNWYDAK